MTREVKGILGFVALTIAAITLLCLFFGFSVVPIAAGGVSVFIFMVLREVWQYKTKQTVRFEYEDVTEYGIVIAIATAVYIICTAIFKEL